MKIRIITGIVLLAIFIPLFVMGGLVLETALLILAMGATWELHRLFSKGKEKSFICLCSKVLFSGLLYSTIVAFYQGLIGGEQIVLILIFILLVSSVYLVVIETFDTQEFGNYFISILYPVLGFSALTILRNMDQGLYIIGFLFMITVMTDVFAYLVGINFGKHRLAPQISPKKSIEGSIGGTVFAVIFTMIYIQVVDLQAIDQVQLNVFVAILIILMISVMGQIGDLVASKLKRDFGAKDYSNLFPGHGGVMDRFDSAIFAALVLLFIVKAVGVL
jgi:phosphatidate cytidylyltransferase